MTEFEGLEDRAAEEDGSRVRELFARSAAEPRPQLGFTAEALVADGRRRVRRRRVAAVLGSTASVAVVAVAATAFAGGGARGAVVSAAGVTTASTGPASSPRQATSPASGKSPASTSKPPTDDERVTAEQKLAAAVFGAMMGRLDPGSRHLTYVKMPHSSADFWPNTGVCTAKTKIQDSYGLNAIWTADGKNPFPRPKDATSPYIQVSIEIYAPEPIPDQFDAGAGWGPFTRTQLPDGSAVRTASAADGHRLQTVRTMGNGQQIVLSVEDSSVSGGGSWGPQSLPTTPFPFTAAQLNEVVSGVSLPLPFADGFQPHTKCGP